MHNLQQVIASESGFSDLSDKQQLHLIERMTESVIKRVLVDAFAELSHEKRIVFESLIQNLEKEADEQLVGQYRLENFLQENLSDYSGMIQKAVQDLKNHLVRKNTQ